MIREDFKTVEELPIDFDGRGSTNGFHYHQVYRKDGWYIYKVTRTYDNGYTKEFFEFFKERVVKTSVYGDNGWEQVEGLGKIAVAEVHAGSGVFQRNTVGIVFVDVSQQLLEVCMRTCASSVRELLRTVPGMKTL